MNQQFNLKTSDYIIIWFRNRKCKGLAEIFEERLSNIGHNVTLKAMDEFKPKNLKMLKIYLLLLPRKVKEIRIMQPNYMNLFMVEKPLN